MKLSITSFDAVAQSEAGSKLDLLNPDNSETGLTVLVLGDNSDAVQKHSATIIRQVRAADALARKAGKEPEFDLEKIKEQNIEGAALRITGWEGVDEAFDKEVLKTALRRNPHWVNQIIEHSNNLANFTKKA